jgi:hypothetical protein
LHVRWLSLVCLATTLGSSACATTEPIPQSCLDARPGEILQALSHAPRDVALQDGTSLSTCVALATSEAELQVVGTTLTDVATRLAQRLEASEQAAYRLGFLIGATERGAGRTAGLQDELRTRIGRAVGLEGGPPQRRDALRRGRRAGLRVG